MFVPLINSYRKHCNNARWAMKKTHPSREGKLQQSVQSAGRSLIGVFDVGTSKSGN